MNKYLKILIIILNIITLWVAISWYNQSKGHEAFIVIITQIVALLTLFSENFITKNIIDNVKTSKIGVQSKSNSSNLIKNIEDSDIKIKND